MGLSGDAVWFLNLGFYYNKLDPATGLMILGEHDEEIVATEMRSLEDRGDVAVTFISKATDLHQDHRTSRALLMPHMNRISQEKPMLVIECQTPWEGDYNASISGDENLPLKGRERRIKTLACTSLTPITSELVCDGQPGENIPAERLGGKLTERFLITTVSNAKGRCK